MGGHGFKPYQPSGIWEALALPESNTRVYTQDKGAEIYRRSLYLFWKRASPPPAMMAFDAPMREACVVRRGRTNTPLQALVSLNEPAMVEAMRFMAERVIKSASTDAARLNFAAEVTLGRALSTKESKLMLLSLQSYRSRYRADTVAAESMLKVGDRPRDLSIPVAEEASWTLTCATLMNTDEFLTQH